MEVRPAVLEDVAQIADVHVLGWQIGYRGLLPQSVLDGLRVEHRIPQWIDSVEQASWPGQGTLVAEELAALVGFANIRPTHDEDHDPTLVGEIASFYVRPNVWGHGIGRSLISAATTRLAEAGFTTATLWVLDSNARAMAFYEAMGWSPDGTVKPDMVGEMTIHDRRYRRTLV